MKTERRQELKTNDLGAFLVEVNDWIRQYTYQIVAGVGVLALGLFVALYVRRSRADTVEASWERMAELVFTPELARESFATVDRLIDATDDREFDMTALLLKGSNARGLITQPNRFHPEFIDDAEDAYRALLDRYADRMQVAATALSGLAYVEECRFVVDGNPGRSERARRYLERLQNEPQFRETPYQTAAAERLLALDDAFRKVTLAEPLPPPPPPPPDITPSPDITPPPDEPDVENEDTPAEADEPGVAPTPETDEQGSGSDPQP